MGFLLAEEVISEITYVLQQELPSKLTQVAARYNDGVELEVPDSKQYYAPMTPALMPDMMQVVYPAVFILDARAVNEGPEDIEDEGAGTAITHQIYVFIACQGDVLSGELAKKIRRYALAIAEILMDPSQFDGSLLLTKCTLMQILYDTPLGQLTPAENAMNVPLEFRVETYESF